MGHVWLLPSHAGEQRISVEVSDHGRHQWGPGAGGTRRLRARSPSWPDPARCLWDLRRDFPAGRLPVRPWRFEATRGRDPRRGVMDRRDRLLARNLYRLRWPWRPTYASTRSPSENGTNGHGGGQL